MKTIAVRVSPEIYEKMDALAKSAGSTITAELREMIESYCDDAGIK